MIDIQAALVGIPEKLRAALRLAEVLKPDGEDGVAVVASDDDRLTPKQVAKLLTVDELASLPIRRVVMRNRSFKSVKDLMISPGMARIRALDLGGCNGIDLAPLAESEHTGALRELVLNGVKAVSGFGVEQLCASPTLRGLEQPALHTLQLDKELAAAVV